jgi:hypothetical protein
MLAVQPRLPLVLALPRARRARRPFSPSQEGKGPYRLPRDAGMTRSVSLTIEASTGTP